MRRASGIICLIFFSPLFPTLAFSQSLTVKVPEASVRSGPGLTYEVIGKVEKGQKFESQEEREGWYRIFLETLGREGWVFRTMVEVGGTKSILVVPREPGEKATGRLPYAASWALAVGINRYHLPQLRLRYAVNDARAIRNALIRVGFPAQHIIALEDEAATGKAIRESFDRLRSLTKEGDRIIIFFSGHATTIGPPGGAGEMGYLLPVEADPDRLLSTGLSMTEVREMAELLPAKHVLFLVDACYSGLLAAKSAIRPTQGETAAYLARGRLRQILTAGERDQQAIEEGGHGIFTKKLLEGLEGEADAHPRDGILTVMELAAFVQGRVMAASLNRQTPFFGTLGGVGQFVISDTSSAIREGVTTRPASPEVPKETPSPLARPPSREEITTRLDTLSLRELIDLVRNEPNNFLAFKALGNAYAKNENWHAAIGAYKRAVALRPDFSVGLYNLGVAYLAVGNYAEAEAVMEKLRKLNPELARELETWVRR